MFLVENKPVFRQQKNRFKKTTKFAFLQRSKPIIFVMNLKFLQHLLFWKKPR